MKFITVILISLLSLKSLGDYKEYKKLYNTYFKHGVKIKIDEGKVYKATCVGHSFINHESYEEYIYEFYLRKQGDSFFANKFNYTKRNERFLDFLMFPYPEDTYTFTKSNNGNYTSIASTDDHFFVGIRYKNNQVSLEQMRTPQGGGFINVSHECTVLKACKWEGAQSIVTNYVVGYSLCNLAIE
jgi:hypothetical protein